MTVANRPLLYADDVETIPADEADDIQRVIQALELILRGAMRRMASCADVHVKTHGYANGEFRGLPNLPEELAQGLFEHDGIHPAVVRFSNAASQPQADAVRPRLAHQHDDKAIRLAVKAFAKAYNAGDARVIASLFVADGEIVDEEGQSTPGREGIEQVFAGIFKEHRKPTWIWRLGRFGSSDRTPPLRMGWRPWPTGPMSLPSAVLTRLCRNPTIDTINEQLWEQYCLYLGQKVANGDFYGRFSEHYLGDAPTTIASRHYIHENGPKFDRRFDGLAMHWVSNGPPCPNSRSDNPDALATDTLLTGVSHSVLLRPSVG